MIIVLYIHYLTLRDLFRNGFIFEVSQINEFNIIIIIIKKMSL